MAWMVGRATQVSVHRPARTILGRPAEATAATKASSSQLFIDERSIGAWPGKMAWTCGHMNPLKAALSTVDSTVGTPNTRAAFDSSKLLLTTLWRSKLAT